jgi:2-polyprenyl-6-methoxyphenol hydroxylase-like FAD-dependent oxidoreductase
LTQLIGIPNLSIRILSVLPWPLAVRIADEIRFGRIFLAGDAAHTMTPYAGKGANTGVQDVHNLAWKLRAVIAEGADEQLLATYQTERQEVGAFYARLSGDMAASDGLIDDQRLAGQGADLIGLPNYHYASEAIVGGLSGNQEVHYRTAWHSATALLGG